MPEVLTHRLYLIGKSHDGLEQMARVPCPDFWACAEIFSPLRIIIFNIVFLDGSAL
jgi:hypothetical protein